MYINKQEENKNKEKQIRNSHKQFTGALRKGMCIRSYCMIQKNNPLSGKQYLKK